jgi:hypothetical protein
MLTLKYGDYPFEPMPAIVCRIAYKPAGKGKDLKVSLAEVTWDIEGGLIGDGSIALDKKWDALSAALQLVGKPFVLKEDATEIYSLEASQCIEGPSFSSLEVLDGRAGYLATNIRYKATMMAIVKLETTVSSERSISYAIDPLGYLTISERGKATSPEKFSLSQTNIPNYSLLNLDPASFSKESSVELSADGTELSFSYTYKELMGSLPASLSDILAEFSLSASESWDDQFLYKTCKVSGTCKLKKGGFQPSIASSLPISSSTPADPRFKPVIDFLKKNLLKGQKLTSEEITSSLWDGSITFSFGFVSHKVSKIAKFSYSISLKENAYEIAFLRRYGRLPVPQRRSITEAELSENGEFEFFGSRPPIPGPVGALQDWRTSASISLPTPTYNKDGRIERAGVSFSFTYQKDYFTLGDLLSSCSARFKLFGRGG